MQSNPALSTVFRLAYVLLIPGVMTNTQMLAQTPATLAYFILFASATEQKRQDVSNYRTGCAWFHYYRDLSKGCALLVKGSKVIRQAGDIRVFDSEFLLAQGLTDYVN